MKKTLIAVAALSAMAASAMAANVTVSGVVDLGFAFQNKKVGDDTTRTFKMNAGQNSGSRVMFKGAEDLGNNVEVGFQLESGFKADNGTMEEDRLFRRESRLYVKTAYGTLHAGRFGALESGTGSLSIFGGSDMAAFGTGVYRSLTEAVSAFSAEGTLYRPDAGSPYPEIYAAWLRLHRHMIAF